MLLSLFHPNGMDDETEQIRNKKENRKKRREK